MAQRQTEGATRQHLVAANKQEHLDKLTAVVMPAEPLPGFAAEYSVVMQFIRRL
jgi:hypothetical protein